MKFFLLTLFSLCLFACIDEYVDSIEIHPDGSAVFFASIYPCEQDTSYISHIKDSYQAKGLKFDSAWFSQKDSSYSLNFRLSFENLLSWRGENDLVGQISLKKIDSLKNGYSFERIINQNSENEDGAIVPENIISDFAIEQIRDNDSVYWEYSLVLPSGATLIKNKAKDSITVQSENPLILNWRFLANEAVSKRILLKADFYLPDTQQKSNIHWTTLIGIILGCITMLLAIAMLIRKLKKLGNALKELKTVEKNSMDRNCCP
jgi:hypothetical protein